MVTKSRVKVARLAAIVTVCALALVWHPQAATGGHVEESALADPVPGGPGFYSVSATAFRPTDSGGAWLYISGSLYNTGTANGTYWADISLPHGATATKFIMYIYNNSDPFEYSYAELLRIPLDGSSPQVMAIVSPASPSPATTYCQASIVSGAEIDNQSNVYAVMLLLPPSASGDTHVLGIRVDYERNAALPVVMSN